MKLLTISGSTRSDSANIKLLESLPILISKHAFERYTTLDNLPIFTAIADNHPWYKEVLSWRAAVQAADGVIISIPEYIHNMPALLKNALEWVTSSGELAQKRVLAMTFTPHEPRGEKAMQSLLWSLQALNANVVVQLPMYQNEVEFDRNGAIIDDESIEILKEAINMLTS